GLATLLWALKNDAREKPGYGDVVAALAAGRTSFVTDPQFEREFYRLSGFRNLGRRAVRVDILERLADLIRPTLGWKPGTGKRPDGAFNGESFIVTPAMMSILGATADDMEAILKGLGYRSAEKPADEVNARLAQLDAVATPASDTASGETTETTGEAPAKPEETAAADSSQQAEDLVTETGPAQPMDVVQPEIVADSSEPATTEEAASAEEAPKPILLWRQGRFERRQPPRQREKKAGEDKPRGKGRPRPAEGGRNNDRPKKAEARKSEQRRPPREERPAKVDPNSPFAMLAALKEQ